MVNVVNQHTNKQKEIVIITDYSPLTDNLINWLTDIFPQSNFLNGDKNENDFTFLKIIEPELIIIDPGFTTRKEAELMTLLKSELNTTKLIVLTYYPIEKYENFMQNADISGIVLKWKDYKKLPFIMNTILMQKQVNQKFSITK